MPLLPSGLLALEVTLAVLNARVWTGNAVQPRAAALAVSGDRIVAVGSSEEVRRLVGTATRVLDARGAFVCPGFVYAHGHPLKGDAWETEVKLPDGRVIRHRQPPADPASLDREIPGLMSDLLSHGITGLHAIGDWSALEAWRRARRSGRLPVRVHAVLPLAGWKRLADLIATEGRGDEWLRWGMVKGFAYKPGDALRLRPSIKGAADANLQVAVHAMGPAVGEVLDVFATVPQLRARRFRVEHANFLLDADAARFAGLGIVASMQPGLNLRADPGFDEWRRAGRVEASFRILAGEGAVLAFGDDSKHAGDPMGIMAAAMALYPDQAITPEQALVALTRGSAYAGFTETQTGTLEPGKLADFVILSDDVTRLNADAVREVQVQLTVVGGAVRYDRARGGVQLTSAAGR